ncbi:MAG: EAL domain-containing protein [Gemmatimonadales bacterium]
MSSADPIHRILYVDDDADVGVSFSRAVRRLGLEADLATSGREALRLARTRFYAVIVTDLRMPGIDGLALIERLSPTCPSTAFVLVSGMPELDLRSNRRVDGAIASVIAKPWDDEELASTLQRAFELHKSRSMDDSMSVPQEQTAGILLVEDNPADADLVIALLGAEHPAQSFVRVGRLRTALERLHENRFDAIIADLILPDARGFDAITRLQAAAPAAPILVVSGMADEDLAQQVVQLGAQDFLVKGTLTAVTLGRALRFARERKRAEQRLIQLAHFDQLTGLANRSTFHDRVTQAATRARRRGSRFAVLYVDLDRFKAVNDSMGHDAGDSLLEEVGRRIRTSVRDYDTVARLGGDEFGVLADDLEGAAGLDEVVHRILAGFQTPIMLDGKSVQTSCSIGIAMYPDAARTTPDLLKCADKALYQAKREGRNRAAWYDPRQGGDGLIQSALAADLNVALKRGEFALHFQPQVTITGFKLVGFEALLRWRRGEEIVPPSVFVPLLDESGGMVAVGHWALREACRRLVEWRNNGAPDLRMAVNMSAGQIEEPGLPEVLGRMLSESGLPPAAIELEVSEQVLMRDTYRINFALTELKKLGIRLSIKGFGTGFSSAAFLSRFRIDCLKVARSFVSAAPDDAESSGVMRAIVALGSSLGIHVLADGVETRSQLNAANGAGCHLAQGYLFGRPMPNWTLPPIWEPVANDPCA